MKSEGNPCHHTLGARGFFSRATRSFVGRRPMTRTAKPREKIRADHFF